jgi:hypothetical protein
MNLFAAHRLATDLMVQHGQKIPRKGKHLMLTENVRAWIEKMELDGPK